jgi:hypothetical protein
VGLWGAAHWPPPRRGPSKHWHFCDLEPGHEGKHRCMSCKVEFDR